MSHFTRRHRYISGVSRQPSYVLTEKLDYKRMVGIMVSE